MTDNIEHRIAKYLMIELFNYNCDNFNIFKSTISMIENKELIEKILNGIIKFANKNEIIKMYNYTRNNNVPNFIHNILYKEYKKL